MTGFTRRKIARTSLTAIMARILARGDDYPVMQETVVSKLMPVSEQSSWARRGESIRFGEGGVLFYADHFPYGIYLITKGRVELTSRRQRKTAGAGVVLGLEACITESPHRFTAVCVTPVIVRFISKAEVLQRVAENNPLAPGLQRNRKK